MSTTQEAASAVTRYVPVLDWNDKYQFAGMEHAGPTCEMTSYVLASDYDATAKERDYWKDQNRQNVNLVNDTRIERDALLSKCEGLEAELLELRGQRPLKPDGESESRSALEWLKNKERDAFRAGDMRGLDAYKWLIAQI